MYVCAECGDVALDAGPCPSCGCAMVYTMLMDEEDDADDS